MEYLGLCFSESELDVCREKEPVKWEIRKGFPAEGALETLRQY